MGFVNIFRVFSYQILFHNVKKHKKEDLTKKYLNNYKRFLPIALIHLCHSRGKNKKKFLPIPLIKLCKRRGKKKKKKKKKKQ